MDNYLLGLVAVISSAIIQGYAAVFMKKWAGYLNPFSLNAFPLMFAGIIMILAGFIFENTESWVFNQKAILSVLYLSIFGTIVAFTTYYWLLKEINAVILSLSSFITPIIAILLGWFFLDETLSNNVIFGSFFVLIGILFGNLKGLRNYYLKRKGTVNA